MFADIAKVESAMNYLATTDEGFAHAKASMEEAEITRKRIRALVFKSLEGSVAQRQAETETHESVIEADTAYIGTVSRFEELKARRHRAELVIDVWRSLEASRRRA